MSFTKKIFFCLDCTNVFLLEEAWGHERHRVIKATVTFDTKRNRWWHFIRWFRSLDIGYCLSFMGLTTLNILILHHLNLSFSASMLEAFFFGVLLVILLRKRK